MGKFSRFPGIDLTDPHNPVCIGNKHNHIRIFHVFKGSDNLIFVVYEVMGNLLVHPAHYFPCRVGLIFSNRLGHTHVKLFFGQSFNTEAGVDRPAAHNILIGNIKWLSALPYFSNYRAVE